MKRMRSPIPSISTKQTITSHLNELKLEFKVLALDTKYGGVVTVNGIQILHS
jgi:hypothetical protein